MASDIDNQATKKLCMYCQSQYSADLTTCPKDGTALTELKVDSLVGTTLDGKYDILAVIGGGGMGNVYRARHRYMKRMVAVKILHHTQLDSSDATKRFQKEAQAASALSMPNITTIYDFGSSPEGQPYMVMDYLEGCSLKQLIDTEGKLPAARALKIFIQISRALAHAHTKGIIHRDIKPSNIVLINSEGEADFVKLVDFGIAKLLSSTDSPSENLTRTGEVFGTALYMSPEQCRGQQIDARTDMYSLGAVMYFVLAGRPVFQDQDPLQIIFKHVNEFPPAFESVGTDVDPELEKIVLTCLAKDPDSRFQSMPELTAALEHFKSKIADTQAPATSNTETILLPVAAAQVPAAAAEPAPERPSVSPPIDQGRPESTIKIVVHKRVIAGVAGTLMLLIAGLALAFFGQPQKPAQIPTNASVDRPPPPISQPAAETIAAPTFAETSKSEPLENEPQKANRHRHKTSERPASIPVHSQPQKTGLGKFKNALKKLWRKIE